MGDSFNCKEGKPPVTTGAADCPACFVPPSDNAHEYERQQACSACSDCHSDQCEERSMQMQGA